MNKNVFFFFLRFTISKKGGSDSTHFTFSFTAQHFRKKNENNLKQRYLFLVSLFGSYTEINSEWHIFKAIFFCINNFSCREMGYQNSIKNVILCLEFINQQIKLFLQ